jgi:hypothetical protein
MSNENNNTVIEYPLASWALMGAYNDLEYAKFQVRKAEKALEAVKAAEAAE